MERFEDGEASSARVSTHVERDLRLVLHVRDASRFEVFLKLCAGRTGQLLNPQLHFLGAVVAASLLSISDKMFFFRDSKGLEVGGVLDFGQEIEQVEVKPGTTLTADFFTPLRKLSSPHDGVRESWLVCGGRESLRREGTHVLGWRDLGRLA